MDISKLTIKYRNKDNVNHNQGAIAKDITDPDYEGNDQLTKYFSSCYDSFNFDADDNEYTDEQLDSFPYEGWDH